LGKCAGLLLSFSVGSKSVKLGVYPSGKTYKFYILAWNGSNRTEGCTDAGMGNFRGIVVLAQMAKEKV
jgi:hypothetical protein